MFQKLQQPLEAHLKLKLIKPIKNLMMEIFCKYGSYPDPNYKLGSDQLNWILTEPDLAGTVTKIPQMTVLQTNLYS